MRRLFERIRQLVEQRYKVTRNSEDRNRELPWQSVSAFCFLRFIVPAILHPHLFGLCPGRIPKCSLSHMLSHILAGLPDLPVQRSLTLIAKVIQSLANLNAVSLDIGTTLTLIYDALLRSCKKKNSCVASNHSWRIVYPRWWITFSWFPLRVHTIIPHQHRKSRENDTKRPRSYRNGSKQCLHSIGNPFLSCHTSLISLVISLSSHLRSCAIHGNRHPYTTLRWRNS